MHPVLTEKIVEIVRQRFAEGDCPTTARPGPEMVEFALMEVAKERDALRKLIPTTLHD